MRISRDRIARAIARFVEHPVTNLLKGIVLLAIGLAEAARTFKEDVTSGRLRVGVQRIGVEGPGFRDAAVHYQGWAVHEFPTGAVLDADLGGSAAGSVRLLRGILVQQRVAGIEHHVEHSLCPPHGSR